MSGTSEADLLRNYPALSAEDLANAWAYLRAHPAGAAEVLLLNCDGFEKVNRFRMEKLSSD